MDQNTYMVFMAAIAAIQTIALAWLGVQGYRTHRLVNGQSARLEEVAHSAGRVEGEATRQGKWPHRD